MLIIGVEMICDSGELFFLMIMIVKKGIVVLLLSKGYWSWENRKGGCNFLFEVD